MNGPGADNGEDSIHLDPLVGKVLCGRFTLDRLIARGGMGKVYEATQQPLGRTVALKVLDIHGGGDEFRQRFFKEASTCAKLSHPHTVRIYDYGQSDDGIYFIAMEYLQGRTLHDLLVAEAPLEPLRVIRIFRAMCGALAEAHDTGIIHRDLKPANVFLTEHGDSRDFVKVIDFGLVKELGVESELSRTGTVLGSPLYMSPEQVQATDVDQRTDVYAVGMMMFTALMGKTAFKRGNPLAVLMAQAQKTPPTFAEANPKVDLPASLEWVVQTCIEKPVEKRFATMHELLRALKAVEKEIRGEIPEPLELELDDGRVVLPEGLDVSSEYRAITGELIKNNRELAAVQSVSTTLVNAESLAQHLAGDPTATQTVVVLGRSHAAAIGLLAVALVVIGGAIGGWFLTMGGVGTAETESPRIIEPAAKAEDHKVLLQSTPPGAEVEHDGAYLGTTPLDMIIPDGEAWDVEVSAEGHESRTVRVDGNQSIVAVPLKEIVVEEPPPVRVPARPDPPAAEPEEKPTRRGDIADPWAD